MISYKILVFFLLIISFSITAAYGINQTESEKITNLIISTIQESDYETALSIVVKSLESEPENISYLNNMGSILIILEKYGEAITVLDKTLEIEPTNLIALSNKGVALLELKRNEEAINYFEKVLEINPENSIASSNRIAAISQIYHKPISDSKYIVNVQSTLRNSEGILVGIIEGKTGTYLPHKIIDKFLDSLPVKETVRIDGKNYEKIEYITEARLVSENGYSFGNTLQFKTEGHAIDDFGIFHHAFSIKKGDTISGIWTILRSVG